MEKFDRDEEVEPFTFLLGLHQLGSNKVNAVEQSKYERKATKVRTVLMNQLSVEVEHLPIERYGPNLNIVGVEDAVREIMSEFGYATPESHGGKEDGSK
jgi:hypothetical protein